MIGRLLCVLLASIDAGLASPDSAVRLRATVVVASMQSPEARQVSLLKPLEARLRTLLPDTSFKGFTEYTAALQPGEALDVRLPDGRFAHLVPDAPSAPAGSRGVAGRAQRPVHVTVDRGETFEASVPCNQVTVFQVHNGSAEAPGERTFLVFTETCPGTSPGSVVPSGR